VGAERIAAANSFGGVVKGNAMKRMNTFLACVVAVLLVGLPAVAQDATTAMPPPASKPADQSTPSSQSSGSNPQSKTGIEHVLSQMDKAASTFRTAQADFIWDQYQKVVNEHDIQKGKVYFRRQGQEIQMAADITEPAKKYLLFSGGKVQVYQPGINQITEYNVAKNRAELESFLVLGFGGSGRDLLKQYEVKYLGTEEAGGVNAEKLQLIPKSVKVRNNVERILLWIDPARGVSVQQQFFEPSGDHRLTKYSNIELNQKIPDNVFKIKTDGKTKVVSPQS
jgi:outer membrane lipoprotein-sorting protein